MPEIGIEKLARSIYALAYPDRIAFNESMIDMLDMEDIMPIIMAHELAHVAAYRVSGIMEHDALWAAFDKVADGNGKITYTVPGRHKFADFHTGGLLLSVFATFFLAVYLAGCCGFAGVVSGGIIGAGAVFLNIALWTTLKQEKELYAAGWIQAAVMAIIILIIAG